MLSEVDRREGDRYEDAAEIFREVALGQEFPAFLTLPAYAKWSITRKVISAPSERPIQFRCAVFVVSDQSSRSRLSSRRGA